MLKMLDVGNAKRRQANLLITLLLMLLGGCSQESTPQVDTSTPGVYVLEAGEKARIVVVDRKGLRTDLVASVIPTKSGIIGGRLVSKVESELHYVTIHNCATVLVLEPAVPSLAGNNCVDCNSPVHDSSCSADMVELANLSWKFLF